MCLSSHKEGLSKLANDMGISWFENDDREEP